MVRPCCGWTTHAYVNTFAASVTPCDFDAEHYGDANRICQEILNREDVAEYQVPERGVTYAYYPRSLIELHCLNAEANCDGEEGNSNRAASGAKEAKPEEHHRCPKCVTWILAKELGNCSGTAPRGKTEQDAAL